MGFTEVSWARLVNLTPWIRLGLCIEGVRCLKPNEHTQITGGEPRVIRSSIDEPQTSHVLVGSGNKTYTQQFKWKWTKQGLYPIEQSLEQSLGPHVSAMRTVFPLGFHIFFYLSPRIVAVEGSLGSLPEGWKLADFSSPIRWGWVEWNDRERSSFVTPLSIVHLCLY